MARISDENIALVSQEISCCPATVWKLGRKINPAAWFLEWSWLDYQEAKAQNM